MKYSVIIPCYNEEENINTTLDKVGAALKALSGEWEILLINDGSSDSTKETAETYGQSHKNVKVISYSPNQGRGKALRTGFKHAQGQLVCSTDADLSYDATYIPKLFNTLEKNQHIDIVLASPYMKGGSTEGVPLKRLLLSRWGNKMLSFAMGGHIKTITCVFRAYRKEVLDSLNLESDGKDIHLEILSKALALGYKPLEYPAILKGRKKGKSKFKFKGTAIILVNNRSMQQTVFIHK